MLKSIKINGVGPFPSLDATFGSRLNLITGDNGLGKSFLLDMLFWMQSETWPRGRMALPHSASSGSDLVISPTLEWHLIGKNDFARKEFSAYFDFNAQAWQKTGARNAARSLVLYAAADGHFAVWDPARNWSVEPQAARTSGFSHPSAYQFNSDSIANGLKEDNRSFCNGLIHDWVNWFYQGSKAGGSQHFKHLELVIGILSPPGMPLKCGVPRNVFAGDSREFPTLQLPYGEIAYPHWPAGARRIVELAYVLVWAWHEHLRAARQRKEQPVTHMLLLIDDIESHLSPQWQRSILNAMTQLAGSMNAQMRAQIFVATHSPLVLSSLEPHYEEQNDMLFLLSRDEKIVRFMELLWVRHGDINAWLMSILFNLKQPRSVEAEQAIIAALQFLNLETGDLPEGLNTADQISKALTKLLPVGDGFMDYWLEESKAKPKPADAAIETSAPLEAVKAGP